MNALTPAQQTALASFKTAVQTGIDGASKAGVPVSDLVCVVAMSVLNWYHQSRTAPQAPEKK